MFTRVTSSMASRLTFNETPIKLNLEVMLRVTRVNIPQLRLLKAFNQHLILFLRQEKQNSPCVLQDIVPFGAAALLPLTPIHNHSKQGNGYR